MINLNAEVFIVFIAFLVISGIVIYLFQKMTFQLKEQNESFVLSFGKIVKVINNPGLHWLPFKFLPWVDIVTVSKKIDYRVFRNINVNDCNGTSIVLDLWVEFRISDPSRALFSVENWEEVFHSSVIHSTTSIISADDVIEVLKHRNELSEKIQREISNETSRWGITLSGVMIQNIGLLPEVSKQLFQSVAAQIEKQIAMIQEEGRIRVSLLDAETAKMIAELNATAKAQAPLEIGKFYRQVSLDPLLLKKFNEYWEISNINPKNTITLSGTLKESIDQLEATKMGESLMSH